MPTTIAHTRFLPEKAAQPDGWRLTTEIIAISQADTWDAALHEWVLDTIWLADDDDLGTCLCGHYPIREHCRLLNIKNGNTAIVGNVCVQKFLGLPSGLIFAAIERIAADQTRALNPETIQFARDKGWIDDWQQSFLKSTCRKRRLSSRQLAKRMEINQQVLYWLYDTRS